MKQSGEGATVEKFFIQPIVCLRPGNNYAVAKVNDFCRIRIEIINREFGLRIKVVILDLDETLLPYHHEVIPEKAIETVRQMVRDGVEYVLIYSNNDSRTDRAVSLMRAAEEEGATTKIQPIHYPKPDPIGYIEIIESMNRERLALELERLTNDQFVMIGDNGNTDGGCLKVRDENGARINFIKVDVIKTDEPFLKKLKRAPQFITRWWFNFISDITDAFGNRKVLYDEDFKN